MTTAEPPCAKIAFDARWCASTRGRSRSRRWDHEQWYRYGVVWRSVMIGLGWVGPTGLRGVGVSEAAP